MTGRSPSLLVPAHRGALALIPLLLAGCGDAEPEAPSGPPVVTEQVAELSTPELLGLDRELILATLPWRDGVITRTASESAATATQAGVEAFTGDGFDRILIDFRQDAPAPGYRIRAVGTDPVAVCGEERTFEENGVLIRLSPATVRDESGDPVPAATEYDLDFPVVTGADLVCDTESEVVWFVQTAPERVEVRMLHRRQPERIAVDIRPAPPAEVTDTTAAEGGSIGEGADGAP